MYIDIWSGLTELTPGGDPEKEYVMDRCVDSFEEIADLLCDLAVLEIDLRSRPGNWFDRSDLERTYGAHVVAEALDGGLIEDVMADYVMLTESA